MIVPLVFTIFFFHAYDFEKPTIMNTLSAIALKHIWGLLMAIIMIGLIRRYGFFTISIFNYPAFRIMGRISYATYMCHLFVVKWLMASVQQPIYLSYLNIVSFLLS